jgi:carbonic anhydrase
MLAIAAAGFLEVAFPALASAQAWSHDPASPIGPGFWGSLAFPFATCGSQSPGGQQVEVGRRQSPVDVADAQPASIPVPVFHYGNTPFEVENTGHVIEVPYAPGSRVLLGGEEYALVQFHFHAPGEHAVAGRFSTRSPSRRRRSTASGPSSPGSRGTTGSTPTTGRCSP